MSSDIDWGFIGYRDDPVPGSPGVIEEGASLYRSIARDLNDGSQQLGVMLGSTDEIVLKAMDEIREMAGTVRVGMSDMHIRYSGAAAALGGYAPALQAAQAKAREAARAAIQAQHRRTSHIAEYNAQRQAMMSFDLDAMKRAAEQANAAAGRANAANADLESAHARIAEAICERNAAAEAAATKVQEATDTSRFNDSWGDKAGAFLKSISDTVIAAGAAVGKAIWENIGTISAILTVASIVLLLFPPAAAFAGAVRLLAGAAKLAGALSKVKAGIQVAEDVKNGDYAQAAVGAVALAGSMALGRVAKSGIKAVDVATRGSLPASAFRQVGQPVQRRLGAMAVHRAAMDRTASRAEGLIKLAKFAGGKAISREAARAKAEISKREEVCVQ